VTIAAGLTFVDISMTPLSDSLAEGAETILLTLGDTGSYDVGSPASATVTIADAGGGAAVPAVPPLALFWGSSPQHGCTRLRSAHASQTLAVTAARLLEPGAYALYLRRVGQRLSGTLRENSRAPLLK
jgi:hypothetical protein